jgi:hypothetical protein
MRRLNRSSLCSLAAKIFFDYMILGCFSLDSGGKQMAYSKLVFEEKLIKALFTKMCAKMYGNNR